jgi:hypothetical protein
MADNEEGMTWGIIALVAASEDEEERQNKRGQNSRQLVGEVQHTEKSSRAEPS